MAKNKLSIRGIIANSLLLIFAVAGIAFMAMSWVTLRTWAVGESSQRDGGSVFEAIKEISNADSTAKVALVFFILFAIVAGVLILTSIVSLVGSIIKNKSLNLTLINRILSFILLVFGLVALICSVVYFTDMTVVAEIGGIKNGLEFVPNGGAVLPMICGILALIVSFFAPSKKKS